MVVLEKDDQEDNGEYSRTESDHLDDKETHQTFEIEVPLHQDDVLAL